MSVNLEMFIIYLLAFKIISAEGRVYCQDSNASAWKPLGLSCPITCSTILSAVDRLKIMDYQNLVNDKERNEMNMSANDLYTIGQQLQEHIVYGRRVLKPTIKNHIKLYNTYHRLLNNEDFSEALKKEAKKMTLYLNKTCFKMAAKVFYKKILKSNKCTRRFSKNKDVLGWFTKFLNKFADPKYPFDEEMAGIILQKLEGNLLLRYGEVDHDRIMNYLKKASQFHSSKTGDQVIRLRSTHCLTMYIPGCYCKPGFVENNGECVKPEDCIANSIFKEYLERIILY